MTQDKFVRRCQVIGSGLARIASGQSQECWTGVVPPDPRLREVLQAQEKLLTAMERFLESTPVQAVPQEREPQSYTRNRRSPIPRNRDLQEDVDVEQHATLRG
jgi:hypothetical protein